MVLDILAILAWAIVLIRYWLTGELKLLIHPNYSGLVLATGIFLLILAIFQMLQAWAKWSKVSSSKAIAGHSTILTPGLSSSLLLLTAILGLVIGPRFLSSQTALQRGLRESLPLTQRQIEHFQVSLNPEARSLVDWVRTLNTYPEPDAYVGQPANVTGFVIHDPLLPDNYLLVARFIITCCAVDAYSVVLPVKLNQTRANYPPDTWIAVEGKMNSEQLSGDRKLVINANSITAIPTPTDPYAY
ncbi:TIGR03943 family protein [Gloeocapsa sp. PCC 73106]|uniref:TIGR03943 family putative permease subunit n=1 Tax=Gloeocapsa sp. PCC 73106 TaxID=102232 RepID=UPI0002ABA13E|nr:TIGR03943 family protein [Gloeocapsa sp. PCC 73106]ELR99156.1 TIGR03943 family protein [Gloeocapsa sp. PCC 73106]